MNPPWKLLVAILILSVGLSIGGVLLLYRPTDYEASDGNSAGEDGGGESSGMQILEALPIYYSNSAVKSAEEAVSILKQNLAKIEESATGKLLQYGKTDDASVVSKIILFTEHVAVEKRSRRNDQYWLLPDREAYVLVVPAVSKLENWVENDGKILVERINFTEGSGQGFVIPTSAVSFEEVKAYLNEQYPGKTATFWTETKLWIKYLVDDSGTVYWAGQQLSSKPWLEDWT